MEHYRQVVEFGNLRVEGLGCRRMKKKKQK